MTKPCNSLRHAFDTVQEAIDDLEADGSGGWVYVPPGTWSEALTIQDADIALYGSGWGSIIDGGTTGHAVDLNSSADRCIVRDLQVKTTTGIGNSYRGITCNGTDVIILRIFVNGSDENGMYMNSSASRASISGCYIYDADSAGLGINVDTRIFGNYIQQCWFGIRVYSSGDNTVISGNIINTTNDDGLLIDAAAENCIYDGNRIMGYGAAAIDDTSGTSTAGDNDIT